MRCVDCAHCDLRSKTDMARGQANRCKVQEQWRYFNVRRERDCDRFEAAEENAVKSRIEWLDFQMERREK
jgi:hypothetical protein